MTVVRASYTTGARGPAASRAAVRYAATRRDHTGTLGQRAVFSPDGELDRDAAITRLIAVTGSHHYRITLNAGEGHHHVDQQAWTRDVMAALEERRGGDVPWVAVEHRDHAAHDHVHVALVLDVALDRRDLAALREAADASWERHAAWARALDPDPVLERVERQAERSPALGTTGAWER